MKDMYKDIINHMVSDEEQIPSGQKIEYVRDHDGNLNPYISPFVYDDFELMNSSNEFALTSLF